MNHPNALKMYRTVAGLLGFSAIITEIAVLIDRHTFVASNFFSYFTIQSNLLAVGLLLYGALYGFTKKTPRTVHILRGAIVLYMVMTGVIFAVMLAGIEGVALTAVPWDNIVLHYIMPIIVLADWFMDTPTVKITVKHALEWLLFPLAYVLYSLVRGPIVQWYPYPFLNPDIHGYDGVLMTTIFLALGCLVASWLLYKTIQKEPVPKKITHA